MSTGLYLIAIALVVGVITLAVIVGTSMVVWMRRRSHRREASMH